MRLEQLQYFVKVVEAHSFNRAATELHITQPALSNSIRLLEQELGGKLFVRSRHGVQPTEWGLHIYEDCKGLLKELQEKILSWKQAEACTSRKHSVHVSIVAIPSACNYLVEHVIPRIKESMPGMEIVLHEMIMPEIYDFMKKGNVHICVTAFTADEETSKVPQYVSSGFSVYPLLEDDYQIFISTEHPLSRKESIAPGECRNLCCATYSNQFNNRSSILKAINSQLGITRINYVNSRENIMQLIAQNKAIGCFLRIMSQYSWYITNGMIKVLPIKDMKLLPSRHFLLSVSDSLLSDDERKIVQAIKEFYI